jgi:hypothetical protein
MDLDQVLILAPDGAPRAGLEEVFLRLGRRIAPQGEGATVVLDLREGDEDMRQLAPALHADPRPLLIVSEQPCPMIYELQNRPAGLALLTGAESDGGYRVALRLCDALGRREMGGSATTEPALTTS